ncbi:MAG TPA: methyltransferase domain-containing protein [Rhizomicrobium sp.]|jgi:SAM-dependent methyltransferase|nr:methyltransferase domain-containing protein [Rhizomicrobium sp.]
MAEIPTTYDPRRFRTTVPYYARYRLAYPRALIDRVVQIVGLKPGDAVMDLGCGPGPLAVLFAEAGMAVTAVDPEPDMLDAARDAAREAGVRIDFHQGSSFDMPAGIGPFKLVTMGRSFHWMDREATLKVLDSLITPDGAVALTHDEHPATAENAWRRILHDVANRYGRGESHHVQARNSGGYRKHESVLFDSPFNRLEHAGIFIKRELTADDIVGLAYSLSTTAPQKLGDRAAAFEKELRSELATLSPGGRFVEIAEMLALIARR